MTWLIVSVVLVLLVFLWRVPARLENRRQPMDDTQRGTAPGAFATLSQGKTHYRWIGPSRGPVAVMVHGLKISAAVWNEVAEELANSGYRVLTYDLYNRGYSDSVNGKHDMQLYLTQLDDLLADQGLDQELTVVGYSAGGAIATEFAAAEPHRIQRLVLVAPGGIEITETDFSKFCRRNKIFGGWLHGMRAPRRMLNILKADKDALAKPHIARAVEMESNRQGYFPAMLDSTRALLPLNQERQHRSISHDNIPTIAIWGEKDDVVPATAIGKLAQWNRKALQEVIEGAGHTLPYSHPKEVGDALRKMLRDTQ